MKIVILDGEIANPGDLSWEGIGELGELTVYNNTRRDELLPRLQDAEIVITNKVPLWEDAIQAAPQLKYIGLLSTGYNQIDIKAAALRGIPVCNVPEYSTSGVAQHTFALLLEVCNQVGYHSREVHQGRWQNSGEWCFWDKPVIELAGKTIGVIGFGNIGKAVARIAKAFGMKVLASGSKPNAEGEALAEYVPLEKLLAESDVVTLHCPLLPATEELINQETIAQMKEGAIVINTARGGLICEADLAHALQSGKLRAAAVDVVSKEPIKADNPLLKLENCFITPHIAWVSHDARKRLLQVVESNIKAYLKGQPENKVN